MKKVLIAGANSYIGTSFENYIKSNYSNEYDLHTVDMIDGEWRRESFSGYDAIFHVAGIAHQKETKKNANLYYEVNYKLAVEMAKKAKMDGVKQFILLSSMSVYGMYTGVITKDTPLTPKSNYGKSKLMAEKAISDLQDEKFCVVIVRPPMVYGLGCRGNFNSLIKFADKLPVFPQIKNQRSMIHIYNLIEFIKMVIDKQLCGLYMPQNKEYMNTCNMVKWISDTHGKKIRMSKALGVAVKMAIPFVHVAKKAFGNLVYHFDLEKMDFHYCVVDGEESVKKSVVSEGEICEK